MICPSRVGPAGAGAGLEPVEAMVDAVDAAVVVAASVVWVTEGDGDAEASVTVGCDTAAGWLAVARCWALSGWRLRVCVPRARVRG